MFGRKSSSISKTGAATILFVSLNFLGTLFAGTAETLFLEGTARYENGEYAQAGEIYKRIYRKCPITKI